MKLSCDREKFSHVFQLAASVAAVRDTKPVLQNVKISAEDDRVLLQATDTELGIRLEAEGTEITEKGNAILPTRRFKSILQESLDKTLSIETKGDKAIISGQRSRFNLATQSADDFPDLDSFTETSYHSIPGKALRELIKRTTFATDEENTRYTLGGTSVEFGENDMIAVATDGRRLAVQKAGAESVNDHLSTTPAIFPPKALLLIERALGDGAENVQIAVSSNRALIQYKDTVIFTRLIEGRFPNWRKIIPPVEGKSRVDLLAGALLNAVRQAAIVASEKQPGVHFTLDAGKLELQAQGAEIGDSKIETPVSYEGPKREVRLDPRFVIDFLRVLDAEKNVAIFISENEPVLFTTDDDYTYVVMPLS